MIRLSATIQNLVIAGCCFVMSWVLSFSSPVISLEARFHQQFLELLPSYLLGTETAISTFPSQLHQILLVIVFVLLAINIGLRSTRLSLLLLVILSGFALLMVQLMSAVLKQIWVPAIWPILSLLATTLLLFIFSHVQAVKQLIQPELSCQIEDIKKHIDKKDYNTAVLMLKHCPFTEEMFDIAYELGQKLELQENWILARFLYKWLVQYDPGMQDFVERIERLINPQMDTDLSITEITQTKHQFGHYQMVGKKARGATATVYEAYDLYTDKRIALKILNQKMDEGAGQREILGFLHEAMTISRLDHPNIVKIHDADILENRAYIAMDYIAGYPMSERLRRKQFLTAAESLRIMCSVLNALIAAHHKGVIHGDIKPANIMYDKQSKHYIVTDFGAAYAGSRFIEKEKTIVGTPAYMSPEQLSGNRLDGRSDLFSLAVTIYHLLSGKQPFRGESLPELKKSVLNDEVNTIELSVPDTIKQLLDKALQKKPYQRFTDARQMLEAVQLCQQQLLRKS